MKVCLFIWSGAVCLEVDRLALRPKDHKKLKGSEDLRWH